MDLENEVNILDYWRTLVKGKKIIALIIGSITTITMVITLLRPKIYQAKATIMPISGTKIGGLRGSFAQMGVVSGVLGDLEGVASPSVQILAVMRSRTLAEKMITKYGLMKTLYADLWDEKKQMWKVADQTIPPMEDMVKMLFSVVTFVDSKKDHLIVITAESRNPKFSADLVNSYVKELAILLQEKTFTAAKRHRIFLEGQLERSKVELLQSGKELSAFYTKNKISNIASSIDVHVPISSDGRGEMPPSLSEAAQQKTEDLQEQVRNIEEKLKDAKIIRNVPQQIYLQYLTLQRELLTQINSLLTQQYEWAKAEEAKEDLNFQVIDWASVPFRKFKPKRTQITVTAFFLSIFLAVFFVFLRDYLVKAKREIQTAPSGRID